jgi:hypothetical protein
MMIFSGIIIIKAATYRNYAVGRNHRLPPNKDTTSLQSTPRLISQLQQQMPYCEIILLNSQPPSQSLEFFFVDSTCFFCIGFEKTISSTLHLKSQTFGHGSPYQFQL